jgi:hypothetical protein
MTIKDGDFTLLDYDYQTGVSKWVRYEPDGSTTIRTDTPVQHILDANTEDLNNSTGQRWGDGKRVASVPMDVYERYLMEARKQGDKAFVKRFLNDSDNAKFRTFGGRI